MTNVADDQDDEIPPETAPESISVSVRGFSDTEHAERFAHVIAGVVRQVSRFINLERLDGITVATDYDAALAQLDRGYAATRVLTRTSDGRIVGVAMAPAVIRNGIVKAHLVFHASVVLPLEGDSSSEEWRDALYLVAHECGHVEEIRCRDLCFPGTILQLQLDDYEDGFFMPTIEALWTEYAACRLSAIFKCDHVAVLEESFVSVTEGARERANAAIRAYRLHGDVDTVLGEAGTHLLEPLRMAAYLIGHLDGCNGSLDDAPRARDLLAASPYAPFVQRLWDTSRDLWSRLGQWSSLAGFNTIKAIVRDTLADGGLILRRMPDGGLYVDIPFRPETMPFPAG